MSEFDPTIDPTFLEYADLELRCHCLLLGDKEDSAEIAEAEDRMEKLWTRLDAVQQRSLRGMASDLSWIPRKGEPPPRGRKSPEDVAATEQQELSAAIKLKDWHRILHYLRLCAPVFQPASLARERAIAYDAIGFPSYARLFEAKAIEFANARAADATETYVCIGLPNSVRVVGGQAIERAQPNTFLKWGMDGVQPTAPSAAEKPLVDGVEYRACA